MRAKRSIFVVFVLNVVFSTLEFIGGGITGSVALLSDALHDAGDAAGIGLAWILEKKSTAHPDERYTYGYARYSVLGGLITTIILLLGSLAVICGAIARLLEPIEIHYDGMIFFAVIGAGMNLLAAFLTREGCSLGQKAVNLHMLEDVLGWLVVLVGAVVMRLTDLALLDPLMSIAVSLYIFLHAVGNAREGMAVILEKAPPGSSGIEVKARLEGIDGVLDVHHVHLWSLDGRGGYATIHAVIDRDPSEIKNEIRREMAHLGFEHVTIETEARGEVCPERGCAARECEPHNNHAHHHCHGHRDT